jgi:hypothetical protein
VVALGVSMVRVLEAVMHVGGAAVRIGDIRRQLSGSVVAVRVVLVAVGASLVADGHAVGLERGAEERLSERDLPQIAARVPPSVAAGLLYSALSGPVGNSVCTAILPQAQGGQYGSQIERPTIDSNAAGSTDRSIGDCAAGWGSHVDGRSRCALPSDEEADPRADAAR